MKILQLREALEKLGFKGDLRVMLKEHLVYEYLKAVYEVRNLTLMDTEKRIKKTNQGIGKRVGRGRNFR